MTTDTYFDHNPSTEQLQITTDSASGSSDQIYATFADASEQAIAAIMIFFDSPMMYQIPGCVDSSTEFDTAPPDDPEKTWKIYMDPTQSKLFVLCNDVQVLEYTLANTASCAQFITPATMTRAKLNSDDTASDAYRVVGKLSGELLSLIHI